MPNPLYGFIVPNLGMVATHVVKNHQYVYVAKLDDVIYVITQCDEKDENWKPIPIREMPEVDQEKMILDAFTAGVVKAVFNVLTHENVKKLASFSISKQIEVCWKCTGR